MKTLFSKPIIEKEKSRIREEVLALKNNHGITPGLSVILIGNDPASQIYTSSKGRAAEELGMKHETLTFDKSVSVEEVHQTVKKLNEDPSVHGILIQRPVPPQFKESDLIEWITPEKDVDGFHPMNIGKLHLGLPCLQPCTPTGIIRLVKHYGFPLSGKHVVIIGRSSIVGKPASALFLRENSTVTTVHSKSQRIKEICKSADILVVAAGKPHLVNSEWIKPGAIVIDVGIHRQNNKVIGDVDFEDIKEKASAITPVPKGIGPMTIMELLNNTLISAKLSQKVLEEK